MDTQVQYVQVQNLTDSPVVYNIPEDNIRRDFGPYEKKRIGVEELQKLYYQPGGSVLIRDFLRIEDKKMALEFGVDPDVYEHEYQWDKNKVDDVLLNGDIDVLCDALDFAPEGIVELIVQRAVDLRIPDVNKRQAIKKATHKDIDKMIINKTDLENAIGEKPQEERKTRRVNDTVKTEETSGRRVS